jgi:hypothetical protein
MTPKPRALRVHDDMTTMKTVYDLRPQIDQWPVRQRSNFPGIVEQEIWEIYEIAKPCSMLAITGFYNLYQSIGYIPRTMSPGTLANAASSLAARAFSWRCRFSDVDCAGDPRL